MCETKKKGYKYYLHCDDDDEWTKDHIEQYYNVIKHDFNFTYVIFTIIYIIDIIYI